MGCGADDDNDRMEASDGILQIWMGVRHGEKLCVRMRTMGLLWRLEKTRGVSSGDNGSK